MKRLSRFVIWICSGFTKEQIEFIVKELTDILKNRNLSITDGNPSCPAGIYFLNNLYGRVFNESLRAKARSFLDSPDSLNMRQVKCFFLELVGVIETHSSSV